MRNYLKALGKGVMKVMSKMGISTVASYTAAQAFEAVGINSRRHRRVLHRHANPTRRALGLDVIAEEVKQRHRRAYPENPTERVHRRLEVGGEYAFRREGELHLFTPEVVFLLQHSTRTGRHEVFGQYSDEVNRLSSDGGTLRGLFEFKNLRPPVPLDDVESVDSIVTRFNTGAMSYGSISAEAHETMAIAMNNLGGRSNSARAGRTSTVSTTPNAAAPSNRSRAAASALPAIIWSTPPTSRSRWPKAPNPVRVASFRASRCIRTSPRPGIPHPASD